MIPRTFDALAADQSVTFRRWSYLEAYDNSETPNSIVLELIEFLRDKRCPDDGTIGAGLYVVVCPDGTRFLPVTFKGALDCWESLIEEFAVRTNRRVAKICDQSLLVSDGTRVDGSDCIVRK